MKKHLVHHGVSHLDDIYARHSFSPPPTQKIELLFGCVEKGGGGEGGRLQLIQQTQRERTNRAQRVAKEKKRERERGIGSEKVLSGSD